MAERKPKLEVSFVLQSKEWRKHLPKIRTLSRAVLSSVLAHEQLASGTYAVSVVFADDAFVKDLNHTYRGKNKPTNILSFESDEEGYLGDMILAFETILREAEEQGKTFSHHLTHLLVHGLLHLLGHDHEEDAAAEVMENKEIAILKGMGIKNPY
jgi:probable rRNA maturation factor